MPDKKWLVLGGSLLLLLVVTAALRSSAWDGVDVAVVGKYASDLGREPQTPLINVQGDLQLFVFTMAGLVGGFILGYRWRELFGPGNEGERARGRSEGGEG